MIGFRVLEHTADVGIEAFGEDLREAFVNAARGMFSLVTDLEAVQSSVGRPIRVQGRDHESLLVAWLSELLYLFDAEGLLFSRFIIDRLDEGALEGWAYGEPIDRQRHPLHMGIKAVTYHALEVKEHRSPSDTPNHRWSVRVIFDI